VTPSAFIADFFEHSAGSVYLCSLCNERSGGRPAEICGRGSGARLDELILQTWDKKDRGTFFAVATLTPRQTRRSKETVHEIVCLHCDIDFSGIDMQPDAVLQQLEGLEYPPSKIVNSGHGLHAYWLLSEALPATPELIIQVEIALRGLADMLGGDPAVCEVARLMRVPGSHNTKNGERLPVTMIVDGNARYELDDLREWITGTRVLIPRKGTALSGNPYLDANIPAGGPAVDVDARLANMRFQGEGDSSIHQTQLAVSAALLNRDAPIDEVVQILLDGTRKAAGAAGERWNWAREEKDMRRMCEAWARKKLNGHRAPGKHEITPMDELMLKEFKPAEFLIPDLIPAEGVTLLCSRPKVGKSWLLYDLAISAALGRELLGARKPKRGSALYLALEDSQRRLRARGEKLLAHHFGSCTGVSTATTWDRVDQGGVDQVRDWVLQTRAQGEAVVCVCVDVLKMIRPMGQERRAAYERDYEALAGLRSLAQELGIAIVVAHHTRKSASDDPQDNISGTLGLAAAADCNIVLERQPDGGYVLDVRGRDVESAQLAAVFDNETCRWTITGDASEARRSQSRRAILDALRGSEGMSPQEIAALADLSPGSVRITLMRMAREGEVKKAGSKYRLPV